MEPHQRSGSIFFLSAGPILKASIGKWTPSPRLAPGFGLLGLVAAGSFLTALGTVVYQTMRAARTDPVKSLRYE